MNIEQIQKEAEVLKDKIHLAIIDFIDYTNQVPDIEIKKDFTDAGTRIIQVIIKLPIA